MTYDEMIKRLDSIVASLERDEALSMDEYKQKATEARQLIAACRKQIQTLEEDWKRLSEA